MVRIIPTRLKSTSRSSSSSSTTIHSVSNTNGRTKNNRSNSPPMRSKNDSTSPSRDAGNGLALRVYIIKVLTICRLSLGTYALDALLYELAAGPSSHHRFSAQSSRRSSKAARGHPSITSFHQASANVLSGKRPCSQRSKRHIRSCKSLSQHQGPNADS